LVKRTNFLLFSFLILNSLYYFDKIYKDVRTVKYYFDYSNWNDTEVIDLETKKWILTKKFPFNSILISELCFLIFFCAVHLLIYIYIYIYVLEVDYVLKDLQNFNEVLWLRFYLFYHSLERFFCKINGNYITVVNNVWVVMGRYGSSKL